jgi:DNA anti-recombination protein RmuC
MDYWSSVFWLLFVIAGGFVITGSFIRLIFLDILLGLILIAIGVLKLNEDITKRNLGRRHNNINESINYLTNQLGTSTTLTRALRERYDHRFLHLDKKRAEIEGRIEGNYRELAKKIMNVENRVNEIGRALTQEIRELEKTDKNNSKRLEEKIKTVKESQKSNVKDLKQIIRDVKAGIPKSLKRQIGKK